MNMREKILSVKSFFKNFFLFFQFEAIENLAESISTSGLVGMHIGDILGELGRTWIMLAEIISTWCITVLAQVDQKFISERSNHAARREGGWTNNSR